MTDMEEEFDPLAAVAGSSVPTQIEDMMHMKDDGSVGQGVLLGSELFHMTNEGKRILLNRVRRGKPLLRTICVSCGRSSHDVDTYIEVDFLEWASYRLTLKMKALGVEEAQPSGSVCRDCHETLRRGFPGQRGDILKRVMEDPDFRSGEFAEARETYAPQLHFHVSANRHFLR